MKFSVGYQPDELFRQSVLRHADTVRELYFPGADFPRDAAFPPVPRSSGSWKRI